MEDRKEYKLGDICTKIGSGATPSGGKEAYKGGNFNLVRSQNILDFQFSYDGLAKINDEQASKLNNVELQENDVLLNITGDSVARACIIPVDVLPGRVNQHVAIIRANNKIIDSDYLLFFLQNKKQKLLSLAAGGATRNALTKQMLENLSINLPPLPTQQKIAAILSSLDDKIELNNKINANLEQQAQALFKNWFVDFAPFGGEMPTGWKEVTLNDVCKKITDGSHYSPKDDENGIIPMLSVKDMETYGFNTSNCKHISQQEFENMKKNDCVPLVDDILVAKDGSYLKEIFICSKNEDMAILSSIAIFRPNPQIIFPELLLTLLKSPNVLKEVRDNYVSGSALPRIVLKDFKKLKFFLPELSVQNKIASLLKSIRFQIENNVQENKKLSSIRDTLLPKLMSGELEVN